MCTDRSKVDGDRERASNRGLAHRRTTHGRNAGCLPGWTGWFLFLFKPTKEIPMYNITLITGFLRPFCFLSMPHGALRYLHFACFQRDYRFGSLAFERMINDQ